MKLSIKKIFILLFVSTIFANASTMYMLTKIPKAYLVVENYSKKIPMSVKPELLEELKYTADELGIDTSGYSHRTFGIIIYDTIISGDTFLTIELVIGEQIQRVDDKEEVYALTYQKIKNLSTKDKSQEALKEELIESVELMTYDFKEQYIEDNK